MKETHEYLIPDYYPDFACKMGACRLPCCVGWPISLSMTDYFRLLGMDCAPELRRRLDCAMHLIQRPTDGRYAQITPRFDGDCPVRLPDGRCALQAEKGEDALADVCRLYPRAPRAQGGYECSCANSCEAVLELFLRREEPIRFVTRPLSFSQPPEPEPTVVFETLGREQEIRLYLIGLIQDRALPMPQRLAAFGQRLGALEAALNARDGAEVERLLQSRGLPGEPTWEEPNGAALEAGLAVAARMVELLDERSPSIHDYGEEALAWFGRGPEALERYRRASAHFDSAFPFWPRWFEHMLVNHMFFARFPFQDRPESLSDEYLALCMVYVLLRFLGLGCMAGQSGTDRLVDIAAAAFRLIDHTSFDRYAGRMLRQQGCDSPGQVRGLLGL